MTILMRTLVQGVQGKLGLFKKMATQLCVGKRRLKCRVGLVQSVLVMNSGVCWG